MSNFSFKKLLASSFVFKANSKASRLLSDEGNNVKDFTNVQVAENSNFDKFLNTMVAMIDYVQNHNSRTALFDRMSIDPSEYQVSSVICDIVSASQVWLSNTSSVLNKPIFKYVVSSDLQVMTPAMFNAYIENFKTFSNEDLFSKVQSFSFRKVILGDLKSVMDNDDVLSLNEAGTVELQITEILHIVLPISDLSKYTAKLPSDEAEDLIVWLSKSL